MKRFAVEAYPSIFLVDGSLTRMYTGAAHGRPGNPCTGMEEYADGAWCLLSWASPETILCLQLSDFATGGYKDAEPLPFYRSPTSAFGTALSVLYT